MTTKQKEFFRKLAKLCDEYHAVFFSPEGASKCYVTVHKNEEEASCFEFWNYHACDEPGHTVHVMEREFVKIPSWDES